MASKLFTPKDRENISWFWNRYLKKKTPWLLVVLLMVLLQGVVYQQFLSITESGLRVIFDKGDVGELIKICLVILAIFATRALISFVVPTLSTHLASDAVLQFRRDLINHVVYLDQRFFDRTTSGDLIMKIVQQVQALSQFVGQTTVNAVRDAATIVIVSGYLIYKNPLLFSCALIILPVIFLLMQMVAGRIKTIQHNAEKALGSYIDSIDEMAGGMRTIKMTSQEPAEIARMVDASRDIKNLTVRLQRAQALMMPSIDLSSAFVYMLVVGGGGYMALTKTYDIDGASIIAFLVGLVIIFDPARLLANFFTQLQANLVLLDSVRSLMLTRPDVADMPNARDFDEDPIDIVIKDAAFAYTEDAPLFEGLNLTFKAGHKTAIVGATGSGKTTILSLITRLYDLNGGQILFNDQDVRDFTLTSVRQKFSIVAQDIVIFNKSIRENICYANPEATDEEVLRAAKLARIDDIMIARGDAPVGAKGSMLSGGQKQRIAIARAFLRQAPVLLLDEATSALDAMTESSVNDAFRELQAGKTTIVVAHKLASVRDSDLIYVLEAGRLIEQGTHDALIAKGGLYAGMYAAQNGTNEK